MPSDVILREAIAFFTSALAGRTRVLEVGCGRGELARALVARGHDVTAIDIELDAALHGVAGFAAADFLTYEAQPFDAVIFTASLHHIAPLARVVEQLHVLLVPGGIAVADDFDLAAPDRETLRWYYETQDLLAALDVYPADRLDAPAPDLLARWQAAHDHTHAHGHHHEHARLHTGDEMRAALQELGPVTETRGPYLYRYISGGLPPTAGRAAEHIFASERQRIADGVMVPVGLRLQITRSSRADHGTTR
jgi:SAM-dependent methyltransferase